MFVCLLAGEVRGGRGEEDNVGLQVGLVDVGQRARLQVEDTDLAGVYDGSYTEILGGIVVTDRQTIVSWLQSRHEIFSNLLSIDLFVISAIPIKTGAIVLFIVFSVFQKLSPAGLRLEESPRDEVIITSVDLPGFFGP